METNNQTLEFGKFSERFDFIRQFATQLIILYKIVKFIEDEKINVKYSLYNFLSKIDFASKNEINIFLKRMNNETLENILTGKIKKVSGIYNGIIIEAYNNSTTELIIEEYQIKNQIIEKKREEEFNKASKELCERNKKMQEQLIFRKQNIIDDSIKKMLRLNFNNNAEIINWFINFQTLTTCKDVKIDVDQIIIFFKKNSFEVDDKFENELDKNNENIFARFIICQYLSSLKNFGIIYDICSTNALEWKNIFSATKI